jgi:uncharacterized protein
MTRLVRSHPLISFFCLASGITWLIWAPLVLGSMQRSPAAVLLITGGGFGPALAALVVTRNSGGRKAVRGWARRIVRWRVDPVWYAAALLLPGVVAITALGLFLLVGGGLLVGFGWVAHRSTSIRWTTLAHFLTDATGIGFALYVLGY